MAVENQNFKIWTGETKRIIVNIVNKSNLPVDLTGVQWVKWTVRPMPFNMAQTPLLLKQLNDGIKLSDTVGALELTILESDTSSLAEGNYYHEVKVKDSNGNIFVALTGTLTVKKSYI